MIALDSSSLIAYLSGDEGADTALVDTVLADKTAVLPPVVITEFLSDPNLPAQVADSLLHIPVLAIGEGFWERAGRLRAKVLGRGRRACLADCLIVQACLDHHVTLVTRDRAFRRFAERADLKLLP